MKRSTKLALGIATAAGFGFAIAVAFAHPMGGPMAGAMQHGDASFADDMRLVHAMLVDNTKIKRTVTNLSDGIRTVTESDDPGVARAIKAHVASMEKRLYEGRVFNLFSPTIPVLFENRHKIKTVVETTAKGSIVTQTTDDPKVADALQAHALEVNELVARRHGGHEAKHAGKNGAHGTALTMRRRGVPGSNPARTRHILIGKQGLSRSP